MEIPRSCRRWGACTLFVASVLSLPTAAVADAITVRDRMEVLREQEKPAVEDTALASMKLLELFYLQRDFEPAWEDQRRVEALLELADLSTADGFRPSDFHAPAIRERLDGRRMSDVPELERADLDILLSDALARYVHHNRFGKVDPKSVNPGANPVPAAPAEKILEMMAAAVAADDLHAYLISAIERPVFYDRLKRAYQTKLTLPTFEDLEQIPGGKNLGFRSRGARVAAVRERLQLFGFDAGFGIDNPEYFDEDLSGAVKAFQRRLGLGADGIVGPATLRTLNKPDDGKGLARIRANLERMRWLADELPEDYLFVDIAAYQARVIRDGATAWSTRVMVGKPKSPTPTFRDEMEYVVFNPTWTVPRSIQKEMKGVGNNYKVVDRRTGRSVQGVNVSNANRYQVVQKPGPKNALGRVKFLFPNKHSIYLHDTPSRYLFKRKKRAFSHGCIRVQDPLKLAEVLLQDQTWTRGGIDRAVGREKTRWVNIENKLPVVLYYLTAFGTEDGHVAFRKDVYGRDPALMKALERKTGTIRLAFPKPDPKPQIAPEPETPASDDLESPAEEPRRTPAPGTHLADADAEGADEVVATASGQPEPTPTDSGSALVAPELETAHGVAGSSLGQDAAADASDPQPVPTEPASAGEGADEGVRLTLESEPGAAAEADVGDEGPQAPSLDTAPAEPQELPETEIETPRLSTISEQAGLGAGWHQHRGEQAQVSSRF